MIAAARIKRGIAIWTMMIAFQILPDGHFKVAYATKYRLYIQFILLPLDYRMTCNFLMAMYTGKILVAAFHPDGNNIKA